MVLRGYFIQYKFIIPESMKHSSYTYQKLFRALYGYTQAVYKSNGKTYKYHRRGVLSDSPYIRPGKNCVVIPQGIFPKLLDFFKTGKNPTHKWKGKGDWKAVYYMNEKDIDENMVVPAIENLLDRTHILTKAEEHEKIMNELENIAGKNKEGVDEQYLNILLNEAGQIINLGWFKDVYQKSEKLKKFNTLYKQLKNI